MDIKVRSNRNVKLPDGADGLSRRNVLLTATVAAGALTGSPSVLADTMPTGNFGAPLVEVHVPRASLRSNKKAQ